MYFNAFFRSISSTDEGKIRQKLKEFSLNKEV